MNLLNRVSSWLYLFCHLMGKLRAGEFHIEACETKGFKIAGIYIGVVFLRRYCATCGYRR